MAKAQLVWKLSDDKQTVTLEMHIDGTPMAHMILEGAELEGLIHDLGKARSEMADPVTPELDPGMRLEVLVDPVWRTMPEAEHNGSVLALRHPGLGWTSYFLPVKEARALAASLTAQSEALEAKSDPKQP